MEKNKKSVLLTVLKRGKIGNPKKTITLNEALFILKGKSRIGKMGLRIAAVRDGFKSKYVGKGKEKYLLDEKKFNKWIEKTIFVITPGYILVSKAAKKLNVTTSYVYELIKKHKIKTKIGRAEKGKIFVNYKHLCKIFNKICRRVCY